MTQITKSKIIDVAEEIRQCRIEASFSVRWEVIKMHNFIGELLVSNFKDNLSEALPMLAKKTNWSERSLYRAAKFYTDYPDLDKIPGGKSASFNRLVNAKLLESGEKPEEKCHHCPQHCPKLIN